MWSMDVGLLSRPVTAGQVLFSFACVYVLFDMFDVMFTMLVTMAKLRENVVSETDPALPVMFPTISVVAD